MWMPRRILHLHRLETKQVWRRLYGSAGVIQQSERATASARGWHGLPHRFAIDRTQSVYRSDRKNAGAGKLAGK